MSDHLDSAELSHNPNRAGIPADRVAANIECVRDEIARRKRTYPNLVRGRQMTQETAEYELGRMMAVLGTLQRIEGER